MSEKVKEEDQEHGEQETTKKQSRREGAEKEEEEEEDDSPQKEMLREAAKEGIVSSIQGVEGVLGVGNEFSTLEDNSPQQEGAEKEEEEEEDNSPQQEMLREAAKEGIISSIQSVEGVLGLGNEFSTLVSEMAAHEEAEDEEDDTEELDTGVTLNVIADADIADDNDDDDDGCCSSRRWKKRLIVLSALVMLPILHVFSDVLQLSTAGIERSALGSDVSESMGTTTPASTTPSDYFCEFHPLDYNCQLKYYGEILYTTPDPSVTSSPCETSPWSDGCQSFNDPTGRRKRSPDDNTIRDICRLLPSAPICQLNQVDSAEEENLVEQARFALEHPEPSARGAEAKIKRSAPAVSSLLRKRKRTVIKDLNAHALHREKREVEEDDEESTEIAFTKYQTVVDTYNNVYGLGGILSGVAITVFNYRISAIAGAGVSGVACLVASFLPPNMHAMAFMLGVLPGLGNNLVKTSIQVALLELFREKRLSVLSITNASKDLAFIVFTLVRFILFPEIGVNEADWRSLLQYQAATYLLCLGGAVALTPLNLRMKDDPKDTVRARILDISGLELFKSPLMYILGAVFLFRSLGEVVPLSHITQASPVFILSIFLPVFIYIGLFLGSLVNLCVARATLTCVVTLSLLTVHGLVMGVLTLTVELFEYFQYAIAYCLGYGLFAGLQNPLLLVAIPLVLGDEHLGLTVGLMSFFAGLGSIVGTESAEAIIKRHGRTDAAFYMAGVSLLLSSAACLLLLRFGVKVTSQASLNKEEGGEVEKKDEQSSGKTSCELFTIAAR